MTYYVGTIHCKSDRKRKKFLSDSCLSGFDAKFIRTTKVKYELKFKWSKKLKLSFTTRIDIWELTPNDNAKFHSLIIWTNFPKCMFIEEGILHY